MRRAVVVALALLLLSGMAFVYQYGDRLTSRLTVEGRRERIMRRLNDREILIRRACGLGTAYVDGGRWRELSAAEQRRAADAIAAWCQAHGGDRTLMIVDATTQANLGRWNGSDLE
jgi:acyl-CoA synthetase (AMP-forming)/AMP-acid ligase II